ncbi:BP74-related protein [Kineosporia babensis]|uniref:BP74 N-terminal domain-containing protein n=1 Tax=Kineosporia babensis TaxID=499548 RepID=A0A9X1NDH2_9ACTN|nr:hypothetical protein [Kineosporia babensis]MCD5311779.1 hypothetical protein [Kineosporia babensis]
MAFFAFKQASGGDREFVFELKDEGRIAKARKILSGEETSEVHVMGRFRKESKEYNPGFSYHLDPDTVYFFSYAIEVCDANMNYLEEHLDEAGGAFLPGAYWCPWDSRLSREIEA